MHNNQRLVFRESLTWGFFSVLLGKSTFIFRLPWLKRTPGARKTLGREIVLTLTIKLLLLYGLWYVFFSHPALHSMIDGMDPERVAATLLAVPK
jgi:hypothetical protein